MTDIVWNFDEHSKKLTITRPKIEWEATVKAAVTGLEVYFKRSKNFWRDGNFTIPGEYNLAHVSDYLATIFEITSHEVSDLLLKTELWYARGFINKPKSFPPALFNKVHIRIFLKGPTKSSKAWMKNVVYNEKSSKVNIPKNCIPFEIGQKSIISICAMLFVLKLGIVRIGEFSQVNTTPSINMF